MKRLIRWFNDFRTGYVRVRICERCNAITKNNHWSKHDIGKSYGHIWLCFTCFYKKQVKA